MDEAIDHKPLKQLSVRLAGEPVVAFMAMLAVNVVYVLYKGVFLAPDSLGFYIKGADRLVEAGFDFQHFLSANPRFGQYIGFITWCATLKSIFGEEWPTAVVALNAVANATLVALLMTHLKRVDVRWQLRAAMAAWCLIAFDLLVWSKGLLSDTTFLLLSTSAVTAWASRATASWRSLILPAGLITLAICWRPTGIALLLPLTACVILRFSSKLPKLNRHFTLMAVVLAVEVAFLAFAYFMAHPERWPLSAGSGHIKYTAHYYDQGQVVWKRKGTYHAPPESVVDYHLITLDRLRYWFACYESEFSFAHKAYNVVFFAPLFAGSALSVVLWARGRFRRSDDLDRLVTVLLVAVLSFSVMHAMLQVDYGWRYRVPIIPCLLMLSAMSANEVVRGREQTQASPHGDASPPEQIA